VTHSALRSPSRCSCADDLSDSPAHPPAALAATPAPINSGAVPSITPLLTLDQVARFLQLNERTIRRMVAARRLPCLRLGRQLRFDPQALSRWLQAREEG
jgi:excisionase family DNA binding protein